MASLPSSSSAALSFPEFIEKCKQDFHDIQIRIQDICQRTKLPMTCPLLGQTPISEELYGNANGSTISPTLQRWYKLARDEDEKKRELLEKKNAEENVPIRKTQNEDTLEAQKITNDEKTDYQGKKENVNMNEEQRKMGQADIAEPKQEALYDNNEILQKRKSGFFQSSDLEPKQKKPSFMLMPLAIHPTPPQTPEEASTLSYSTSSLPSSISSLGQKPVQSKTSAAVPVPVQQTSAPQLPQ